MPQGKTQQKSARGVPRKKGNKQREVRRARNAAKRTERKLRHILKRNTPKEAERWVEERGPLGYIATLRKLKEERARREGR